MKKQAVHQVHHDLLAIKDRIFSPSQLNFSEPSIEAESQEYGACEFKLNGLSVKFRVAKVTPTKIGHFVTLWKRNANKVTQPYDISDPIDLFVISARKDNYFGHFVFPKSVLCEHDIVSVKGQGGKRGIRVYPPWDKTTSRQAQKTQAWQINYFIEIPPDKSIDLARVRKLYNQI